MKLNAPKPRPIGYPKSLITIGDHIRARRMDLRLLQEEVAEALGITEACLGLWELGKGEAPRVKYMPKIIKFLGYVPFKMKSKTLGEKIKSYRLVNGMTHYDLAEVLKVNASTISAWENNENIPKPLTLQKLEELVGKSSV